MGNRERRPRASERHATNDDRAHARRVPPFALLVGLFSFLAWLGLLWPPASSTTKGTEDPLDLDEPLDGLDSELQHLAAKTRDGADTKRLTRQLRSRARRGQTLRRALVVADLSALVIAAAFLQLALGFHVDQLTTDMLALVALGGWVVLAQIYGVYDNDQAAVARSTADDVPGIVLLTTFVTWISLVALDLVRHWHPVITVAAEFWGMAICLMLIGRICARAYARGRTDFREPTLIVGAGKVGLSVARKLALRPRYGLDVIGFLDDEPLEEQGDGPPHLGSVRRLDQVIRAYDVERVIIAFSRLKTDELVEISRQCMDMGVQVDIVPRMYEVIGSRNVVHYLDGMPLLGLRTPRLSRSSRLIKRSFDLAVAVPILLALSPLFLFVAWRIRATSPGPVFFRQERMGTGGKRFRIWKFRTMFIDADARKAEVAHMNVHTESGPRMFKILDDPRITPIGASLRKWSIDEMPQLINVLRGEMSLVGPRPLILDEDQHIVGSKRRRLDLTPGITGLWQVVGRSDVPFAEMIALDYLYVTNWSLLGDIKLLAQTLPAVLQRRGAY